MCKNNPADLPFPVKQWFTLEGIWGNLRNGNDKWFKRSALFPPS